MKFSNKFKIISIVGARPNFIKIAPLYTEFQKHKEITPILIHTGQHYDLEMSQIFFQELKIPKPDYNLGIGLGSHAQQTAKVMLKLEPVILKEKPDLVIVVGDVNSTLTGALVAVKLHIPVAHIEAGLRSFDMSMPEEINRRLTDHISNFLFVTEPSGVRNLLNEGIDKKKMYLVGDIMIDTLVKSRAKIQKSKILEKLKLKKKEYAVLTLHRPPNVDKPENLKKFLEIFKEIQKKIKIVFPIHPRTRKQLFKLIKPVKHLSNPNNLNKLNGLNNLIFIPPLGYIDFLALVYQSKFVLTDSGGIQEEATFLKVPCLTLRKNTERPITISQGTNTLCGDDKNKILKEIDKILKGKYKKGRIPKLWDGKTAKRIVKILIKQ